MQAVILAAGKGMRMRPLTLEKPKPLIEIAGKSILEHNLDQLVGLVEEVIIIIGYKKEMIIEKFGDNYKDTKITYVVQEEQLGTGHALLQAEEKVTDKFLMLNGDDLYSKKDMKNLIKHDNAVLLQRKEGDVSDFGVVVVKEGKVVDIVEKPKEFVSDLINTQMFCFTKEVFSILKNLKKSERGEYEVTDAVKELAKQGKMHYEEISDYWIPVGQPKDIDEATRNLLEKKKENNKK
ncbi:sugar phosphate nucleotidyltransferase [Nanoarchaeota archaeon]